ncbi:MAG: hypothetical protein CMH83_04630 [Nocardioides sp.]|nr:hypothetical protein [Nocardioides sp.]
MWSCHWLGGSRRRPSPAASTLGSSWPTAPTSDRASSAARPTSPGGSRPVTCWTSTTAGRPWSSRRPWRCSSRSTRPGAPPRSWTERDSATLRRSTPRWSSTTTAARRSSPRDAGTPSRRPPRSPGDLYVDLPPGLANARDTGGLPTVDGGHTRAGRLLRSATPFLLGPDEVAALLEGTGLALRVDLRSRGELAGTAGSLLARHEVRAVHAPLRSGGPDAVPDLADPVEAMTAHYLRYLEHSPTSFAAIVSALVEPREGPALLHCTLGKDRTGVVAGGAPLRGRRGHRGLGRRLRSDRGRGPRPAHAPARHPGVRRASRRPADRGDALRPCGVEPCPGRRGREVRLRRRIPAVSRRHRRGAGGSPARPRGATRLIRRRVRRTRRRWSHDDGVAAGSPASAPRGGIAAAGRAMT